MGRDNRLIDRERDLETAGVCVRAAAAGDGGALLFEGPSGIGKSALLEATAELARAAGVRVVAASGSAAEADDPLALARHVARRLSPARLADLDDVCTAVAAATDAAPLALVLDDLQHADDQSLRVVDRRARELRGRPGLVVAGWRSAWNGAAPGADLAAAATVVRPRPLDCAGVEELLERELDGPAAPAFAVACHEASAGNPGRLTELVAELLHRGVAPVAAEADLARELGAELLARVIRRRLEEIDAVEVAETLALLGAAASAEGIALVLARPLGEVHAALDRMRDEALLNRADPPRFARREDGDAVLTSMTLVTRTRTRGDAARMLAADGRSVAAGRQLLDVPPAGDPKHVAILAAAAEQEARDGSPELAIRLLRRLLAEPARGAARARALVALGSQQVAIGDDAGVATLRLALDEAREAGDVADAAAALGWALARSARGADAAIALERARTRVRDVTAELAVELDVQIAHTGAWDVALAPARSAALARLDGAARWSPLAQSGRLAAHAFDAVASCRPADDVVDLAQRALANGALVECSRGAPTALGMSMMLGYAGRPDLGGDHLEHAMERLQALGARALVPPARWLRGALASMAGRLDDAEADLRTPRDAPPEGGRSRVRSTPLMTGFLALTLQQRGDVAGAAAVLAAVDLDDALLELIPHAPFLYARAQVRLARGDPHAALEDLRRCGRHLEAGGWRNPAVAPWRGAAARILMGLDDWTEADRLAGEQLELAEAFGAPHVVARALRDRAVTVSAGEARTLLERGVEVAAGAPGPLPEAAARTELGALLVASDPAEARSHLREALALARSAGAGMTAARAAELLEAAGGRPRRADESGLRALTPAERRVAGLAAYGATNREIADELVVTLKTVESHLRAVYRKLGIRSRAQLPEAMERLPLR